MKNLMGKIFSATNTNSKCDDLAITLLRVFIGLAMAFSHGLGKLPPSEQLVGGVASMGLPAPEFFAWCAGLAEFVGGLFIAVGFLTRPAAAFLFITMAGAAFVVHAADPFGVKELAFIYLIASLFFILKGAGRWSVDNFICKKKS